MASDEYGGFAVVFGTILLLVGIWIMYKTRRKRLSWRKLDAIIVTPGTDWFKISYEWDGEVIRTEVNGNALKAGSSIKVFVDPNCPYVASLASDSDVLFGLILCAAGPIMMLHGFSVFMR